MKIIDGLLRDTSQRDLAKQLGVSPQFLHDVINKRREIGTEIPKALGLEKVVDYRKVKR